MVPHSELLTYLTEATEPGPGEALPRAGDVVELRPSPAGTGIEAWSPAGQRLGRLPPAESAALSGLLAKATTPLRGRIAALVPRPRLAGAWRIHIHVAG